MAWLEKGSWTEHQGPLNSTNMALPAQALSLLTISEGERLSFQVMFVKREFHYPAWVLTAPVMEEVKLCG